MVVVKAVRAVGICPIAEDQRVVRSLVGLGACSYVSEATLAGRKDGDSSN